MDLFLPSEVCFLFSEIQKPNKFCIYYISHHPKSPLAFLLPQLMCGNYIDFWAPPWYTKLDDLKLDLRILHVCSLNIIFKSMNVGEPSFYAM